MKIKLSKPTKLKIKLNDLEIKKRKKNVPTKIRGKYYA